MKNHTDVLIFHTASFACCWLFVSEQKQIAVMADEKSPTRISHRIFATSCLEMRISVKRKEVLQNLKKCGCCISAAAMLMTMMPAGMYAQTVPVYAADTDVADSGQDDTASSVQEYFPEMMTVSSDTPEEISDEFETEEPEDGGNLKGSVGGYKQYTADDGVQYLYYDRDDGTVYIAAYATNVEELIVPQTIDGKQVYGIENTVVSIEENNNYLKKVVLPEGLKEIGMAFHNCVNLETVVVPDSVEKIGRSAFYRNHSLKEINWPKNLKVIGDSAFRNTPISSAILPEGLLEIGDDAFRVGNEASIEPMSEYARLKELVIPSTVEKIGNRAFFGQARITSAIQLPAGLKELGKYAFEGASVSGDIVIPKGITQIPNGAFEFTRINSVVIPEGVKVICDSAFYDCLYLTTVSLPESLTTICNSAFALDEKLDITIPKNVTLFNNCLLEKELELADVFFGVKSVTFSPENPMYCSDNQYIYSKDKKTLYTAYRWDRESYIIPDSVQTIGYMAFKNTKKVKSVTIPNSVTYIDDFAFSFSEIPEIVIPDSVTHLGQGVFGSCESLKDITISKNVTELPEDGFGGDFALEKIVIPDNITKIGSNAFYNCWNLKDVTLSKNLTVIERNAFSGCTSLKDIKLPSSLVEIDRRAFENTDLRVVELPENVEIVQGAFSGTTLTSVILNEKIKTLYAIFQLAGDKFIIPNSVEKIENASFQMTKVNQLAIPGNVTSIEGSIFSDVDGIKNLWIENASLSFGSNVFYYVNHGADFYTEGGIYGYEGSTAQQEAQKAGIPFYAVSRKDCGNGNAVTYADSEFTESVTPSVVSLNSASDEYKKVSVLANTDFAAYQVRFNGQSGQLTPNAMVKVSVSLPQGYDIRKCHAYVLNADGELEMVQMDKTDNTLSFYANAGGTFVVTKSAVRSMEYTKNYRVRFYELRDSGVKYEENYVVKEGGTVQAPDWTYQCHALSWDYDFSRITEDVEIHPVWTESHEWNTEYTIDKSATTTEEGQKSIHCSVHKDVMKQDSIVKIPKLVPDGVSKGPDGELHYYRNNEIVEDYNGFAYASDSSGKKYWFDYGVVARDKQVYDPLSTGWYWFDADGTMAVNKDVFVPKSNEDRSEGKWVRYDVNGHMVKGTDYRYGGTYYFDEITGEMAKGFIVQNDKTYYYDSVTGQKAGEGEVSVDGIVYRLDSDGSLLHNWWWQDTDGNQYWYENGIRQGLEGRGKEIYDPMSDAWYWLDSVDNGKKAVSKDVYQESSGGKWVRYDAYGHMVKGWIWGGSNNAQRWYFDLITGAMAKGQTYIDGNWYYFNEVTGVLEG